MAEKELPMSFNDYIQADRKKREHERLAQEMLGKHRPNTPSGASKRPTLGASLASRVGVTKRTSSLTRAAPTAARTPRNARPRAGQPGETPRQSDSLAPALAARNNGVAAAADASAVGGAAEISIKGAAGGPYIVMASNFVPGTTAADIESVMASVGGEIMYCKLVASSPTVIAEMCFTERAGADAVIGTFNNKKADGRLLYVYMRDGAAPSVKYEAAAPPRQPVPVPAPAEPQQIVLTALEAEDTMDVDETARSREAADRLREERRGGREDRPDVYQGGPRGPRGFAADDYYYNGRPPRVEPAYQDGGRYAMGGGGGGHGGRGRWYDDRRGYARGGGGGGGRQGWRP